MSNSMTEIVNIVIFMTCQTPLLKLQIYLSKSHFKLHDWNCEYTYRYHMSNSITETANTPSFMTWQTPLLKLQLQLSSLHNKLHYWNCWSWTATAGMLGIAGNTTLVCMAACADAGKRLHTLPSHPRLHEPQGFTWKNANKQGSPVCCHHSEWYSAGQCCWVPNFALAQLWRGGSTHRRGHDWHEHGPGRAGWSNQYLSQMASHSKPRYLAPSSKLCHNRWCHWRGIL